MLIAGNAANVLVGGSGGDDIQGGAKRDIVLADNGHVSLDTNGDVVLVSSNMANLLTGLEEQTLTHVGGDDDINVGDGPDIVIAGVGNDYINWDRTGSAPNPRLGLDSSPDVILGDSGEAFFKVYDGAEALSHIRTIDDTHGGDDKIWTDGGFDVVLGGAANDDIDAGTDESRDIALGDNGVVLFFDNPHEIVKQISSTTPDSGGSDEIIVGGGDDIVIAGYGSDFVNYTREGVQVPGDTGADYILGDSGKATFDFDATEIKGIVRVIHTEAPEHGSDDLIYAADGPDTVFGGTGADTIDGGSDNSSDIAVGDNGFARFDPLGRLIEVSTGDHAYGGVDTITTGNARDYVIGGDDGDIIVSNGGDDVVLGDTGHLTWSTLLDPPILIEITSPSEDTAHGGDDVIDAGDGNDLAFGGTGSDTIYGRDGNDVLSNYQATVTIPLPAPESVTRWGDQGIRYLWDQPMSLFATENFTPLTPGGDASTGTGPAVPSNNRIHGENGDDFYLIVPGGQDTIDESLLAWDEELGQWTPTGQATGYDTISYQTSDRGITFDPDQLARAQYVVDPVGQNPQASPVTVTLVRTDALPERSVYENVIGSAHKDVIYTDTLPVVRTFKGGTPVEGDAAAPYGDELRVRTYGNMVTDNGQILSVNGVGDLMHYEFETIEWMDKAPQIYDDGDFTFNYLGNAHRDNNKGFQGDSLRTYRGREGRGEWTLGGLSPGKYHVSITAPRDFQGMTRYQVLDSSGSVLISEEHEQKLPIQSYQYGDVDWRDFSAPVEISDHILVAAVESVSTSTVSYIDAVSLERMRINAPEIRVTEDPSKRNMISGTSEVEFGVAKFGEAITRDFVVENLGDQDLVVNLNDSLTDQMYRYDDVTGVLLDRLGTISAPDGYQVEFIGGERVVPGGSTTMRVTLLADQHGLYEGTLAFETNDVDEAIFRIDVSGVVDRSTADVIYADNGSKKESPEYFSFIQGKPTTRPNSRAFGGFETRMFNFLGDHQVAWSWDDLNPGIYRISTTWYGNIYLAAEDSPFEVTTSAGTQSVLLDQSIRPGDVETSFHEVDADWVDLFELVTVGVNGDLTVTASSTESGWVYADAIRLEPLESTVLDAVSELRISDVAALNAGESPTSAQVHPFLGKLDFGQTQMTRPVERTLRLHNDGLSDLLLPEVPTVSPGFTLVSPTDGYPRMIPSEGSVDLTIRFDAHTIGTASGELSLPTEDPKVPTISIDLSADVRNDWKLDNSDTRGEHPEGYSQSGKFYERRRATSHDGTYSLTHTTSTGAQANWTFNDLEDGWYAAYTTWHASGAHSTTAQYEISGGVGVSRRLIDQSQKPNDLQGDQVAWEFLSYYYVDNATLTVTLTDTDTRRSVVSDAVRLQRIHQPRVSAEHNGLTIAHGSVIDFGLTKQGTPTDQVLRLTNTSELPLSLESLLAVPVGYTVIDFNPAYLAPSESVDLTVRQTATSVGIQEGTLLISTSDLQQPVTKFVLRGQVVSDALVLDDRDQSFEKSGLLISLTNPRLGWHENTMRLAPTNQLASAGTWVVEGLDPGRYNIGVTWVPYSSGASNVPLTVSSGSNEETAYVDQLIYPGDHAGSYHDRGSDWIDAVVDYEYSDDSQPLQIKITNSGINGKRVVIDAIRIERMDDDSGIPRDSNPGDSLVILNHNDAMPADTNLDGEVTALDALLVINNLDSGIISSEPSGDSLASGEIQLTDVNADGVVTTMDALAVLNEISRVGSPEGESPLWYSEKVTLPPQPVVDRSGSSREEVHGMCLEERDLGSADLTTPLRTQSADAVFAGRTAVDHSNALESDSIDNLFGDLGNDEMGLFGEQ